MRRIRHLVGPPLAAMALLALAACGTVETPSRDSAGPGQSGGNRVDAGAGSWTQLPDSPLSPRERPATAHVETGKGDLVVFIGGYIGRPCPPNADCSVPEDSTASDGASFNLDSGTWETIADAPRPVSSYAQTAVIGDTVYVLTGGTLLSWDVADDHWTELVPPANPGWSDLVADGDRLILASGSDENSVRPDQVYDTNTGAWTRLASDPLKPSLDRILVSTPSGLVLTAKPIAAAGGPEDPALVHAAVIRSGAEEWRVLPPAENQLGGWSWTWTGTRLVDPTPGGADGGQVNNYGRTIPYGGALDPATGTWSTLADTPGSSPADGPSTRWVAGTARSRDGSTTTAHLRTVMVVAGPGSTSPTAHLLSPGPASGPGTSSWWPVAPTGTLRTSRRSGPRRACGPPAPGPTEPTDTCFASH
ncbi:MAG: hypothetical protein ACXWDM_01780 [Nocardioides sp.]